VIQSWKKNILGIRLERKCFGDHNGKENIFGIRVRRKIFCDSELAGKYFGNQIGKEIVVNTSSIHMTQKSHYLDQIQGPLKR
jgi:hypothetical protein